MATVFNGLFRKLSLHPRRYAFVSAIILTWLAFPYLGRWRKNPRENPFLSHQLRYLPLVFAVIVARLFENARRTQFYVYKCIFGHRQISSSTIQVANFPGHGRFGDILDRIGRVGPRLTGNAAHESLIDWLYDQLSQIPNIQIRVSTIDLLRWRPHDDLSLEEIATLSIGTSKLPIAGAVPYSKPTKGQSGELIYLASPVSFSAMVKGKIVLIDFPSRRIPYAMGQIPSYSATKDLESDLFNTYDRPGFADQVLHKFLLAAGRWKAAGVIFMFDLPRQQVISYFEPHKGTHYQVPALYLGFAEAEILRDLARGDERIAATIAINAEIVPGTSRNLIATLPGQIESRIIYVTHTDGNTYIQENGSAALITLAQYFAALPLSARRHTLEFAFNTGHLHISKEGTHAHACELDSIYDSSSNIALVIPVEHLGAREIEARRNPCGPGRELHFTGRGEVMFWCTGPMPLVVRAVEAAVSRHNLDRVLVTRGVSTPNFSSKPMFTSFGGIGTYYHNKALPTTSLISGPWSLWAPSFGKDAVDIGRLRDQTMALGDVFLAIDLLEDKYLAGGYEQYRKFRSMGGSWYNAEMPGETANSSSLDGVKYSY